MRSAEDCNQRGNDAFKNGCFTEAVEWYTKAIDLDGGLTAEYFTNRANAHIKLNSYSEAWSDAKYAIEADPKWTKGYYYSAISQEALGQFQTAATACKKGLELDPDNAALQDSLTRILKAINKQKKHEAARSSHAQLQTLRYNANVGPDAADQQQRFSYTHLVDSRRLQRAIRDKEFCKLVMSEISMSHQQDMLRAKPWKCLGCHKPATQLISNLMAYLRLEDPMIYDLPNPTCAAQECQDYCITMMQMLKLELEAASRGGLCR